MRRGTAGLGHAAWGVDLAAVVGIALDRVGVGPMARATRYALPGMRYQV